MLGQVSAYPARGYNRSIAKSRLDLIKEAVNWDFGFIRIARD